jgi:hypothetical protein
MSATIEVTSLHCPEAPRSGDNRTHHLVPNRAAEAVMKCTYCGLTEQALRDARGIVKRTQDELAAALTERFGPDPTAWAFICPSCGDVARSGDFKEAMTARGVDGYGSDRLGQECIGRWVEGRGCDWAAYGLFRGPEFVIMSDGREVASFPIAPKEA